MTSRVSGQRVYTITMSVNVWLLFSLFDNVHLDSIFI